MYRGILEMPGGNTPYFLARTLAPREPESSLGRDARRKRVIFQCVVLVFWFSCTFSHFGNI